VLSQKTVEPPRGIKSIVVACHNHGFWKPLNYRKKLLVARRMVGLPKDLEAVIHKPYEAFGQHPIRKIRLVQHHNNPIRRDALAHHAPYRLPRDIHAPRKGCKANYHLLATMTAPVAQTSRRSSAP
jgi:hypothetical protein